MMGLSTEHVESQEGSKIVPNIVETFVRSFVRDGSTPRFSGGISLEIFLPSTGNERETTFTSPVLASSVSMLMSGHNMYSRP